ncbi:MAG: hypothetical protein J6J39_03050, partial [Clostridia bacterium]|nr:hypothetical protein [Clostridia bacterium]
VNAVFVYDDKLLLTFNFKDGTRTISLTDTKIAVDKNTGSNLDCSVAPVESLDTQTRIEVLILFLIIASRLKFYMLRTTTLLRANSVSCWLFFFYSPIKL